MLQMVRICTDHSVSHARINAGVQEALLKLKECLISVISGLLVRRLCKCELGVYKLHKLTIVPNILRESFVQNFVKRRASCTAKWCGVVIKIWPNNRSFCASVRVMSPVPGGRSTMSISTVRHMGAISMVCKVLWSNGARHMRGWPERAVESDRHVRGPTATGSKV